MLTGADHKTAIEAVNEGHVFRFLTKPCPQETLELALEGALLQYRLVTAERALLSGTLMGAVKILTDVLSTVRPVAFGRTERVRILVRRLSKELIPDRLWQAELAAMLSQVGCVAIPEELLARAYAGGPLSRAEARLYEGHPQVGHKLVAHVPRLQQVAEIILQQNKQFDGGGTPEDGVSGEGIPMEARILKVALDFDSLTSRGLSLRHALAEMSSRKTAYDKPVLDVLKRQIALEAARSVMAETVGAI
jgi:HD-GYP domain-containing protein (c-di-GMP phosphodiesterase class II)